jgi:recombination protein RecT
MNDLPALVDSTRAQFVAVRCDKSMEFEREAGFALQILRANDYLGKVALGNPESLKAAVTNVAAIGVSLNPAGKLAYLVPRKSAVCLDISYMGLLDIAQSAGAIRWGQAVLVREKDQFELQDIDKAPLHKYQPFGDRGPIVGVYVVVKTPDGDYLTHPMKLSDVYAIRDRSEAWKAYVKDKSKTCPWVTDEGEMIKKTCVKQAAKYWPKSPRLDAAIHHLNTDAGEGITLTPNKMPESEYLEWKAQIEKCTTKASAKSVWKKALAVCEDLSDATTAELLKQTLVRHGEFIDNANKVTA